MSNGKLPAISPELAHLERVPISSLVQFQGDLKILTTKKYIKLRESITEHGLIVPFFVWVHNNIYYINDGHQRQRVFNGEGWDMEVPIIRIPATDERDAKEKLLAISSQFGQITQEGWDAFTWDIPDAAEMFHFDGLPFVFGDFGEGEQEQEKDSKDAEPQTNRAEELREKWGVELGQLWRLPSRTPGQEHRLICGDCTDGAVVERVMGGEKADLLFTDPPYGVEMDEGFGGAIGFGGKGEPIKRRQYADDWDSKRPQKQTLDLHIKQAALAIIFGGNFFADILPQSTHWVVWDKLNTMPTFGDCELAWTNSKRKSVKKITYEYNGLIGKEKERFHPTQKPVGLYLLILKEYSEQGQVVADFYHGSGTTLIACENLARQCRAVELSPTYVAVALQRYEDAFGITPELIG